LILTSLVRGSRKEVGMHVLTRLTAAVLLASTLMAAPAPAAPVAAGIKLSPEVGPPTLPFGVQGRGFGANELVDITFDLTAIGSATTNGAGSFSKKVSVPTAALPGAHTVTATGETSHLTASSRFTVRTNWSKFHFDAANTGFNPFENVLSASNVSGLVEKWSTPTAPGTAPDPAVSGGIVYVAPADGIVRALDPADGSLIWSYDTGGKMPWGYAPSVFGGAVYAANDAGDVVALAIGTGQKIWSVDLGTFAQGNSVANGTVYVTAYDGISRKLYALSGSTGAILWSQGGLGAQPPVAGGLIYFGGGIACSVVAYNAVTGAIAWVVDLCGEGGVSQQAGAVSGGALFGQFETDVLDGLTTSNGNVLWRQFNGAGVALDGAPAVAKGVVYQANDSLWAFDQISGHFLWSHPLGGSHSSPAVANGVVYVGTDGGTLRAYDATTGSLLSESPNLGDEVFSPAVSDGVVYVGTLDGVVHAFALP
jgi:outer membrane protein assembly factor BamB